VLSVSFLPGQQKHNRSAVSKCKKITLGGALTITSVPFAHNKFFLFPLIRRRTMFSEHQLINTVSEHPMVETIHKREQNDKMSDI